MQIIRKCVLLVVTLTSLFMITGCKVQQADLLEDSESQQEVPLENDENKQEEETHRIEGDETIDTEEIELLPDSNEAMEEEETQSDSEIQSEMNQEEKEFKKIEAVKYSSAESIKKKILKQIGQESVKTVYTKKYQEAANTVINKQKEKQSYTLESPLLLLDPYGTIQNGLYLYYSSEEPCLVNYTIYVDHDAIPTFHGTLSTSEVLGAEQEGLIVGLIAGMKNYLVLTELDETGETLRTKAMCIDFTSLEVTNQVLFAEETQNLIEVTQDSMELLLTDETADKPSIRFLDEAKVKRLEIGLQQPTNLEVVIANQCLVFPKDAKTLIVMNPLGNVVQFLSLDEYRYKRGLIYNESTNCVYLIAELDTKEETTEVILSVNLETAECTTIFDSFTITEQTGIAVTFESLGFYNDHELLVNSEVTSSIFCINILEGANVIKYVISNEVEWKGTYLEELVYQGIGSFESLKNQKQIAVDTNDKRLIEGQYYVTMTNQLEDKTVYYRIFVDENTKTFTLANMEDINEDLFAGYQLDLEETSFYKVVPFDFGVFRSKSITQFE